MIIKTQNEIDIIREGGKILGKIMDILIENVKPGISVTYLDELAEKLMIEAGGEPAFKGYKPPFGDEEFPSTLCVSVNNQIVHTPANTGKILQEGEILSIDVGLKYKGLFTDMARTIPVGNISNDARELLLTTQSALESAIDSIDEKNGTLYDIGDAVENIVDGRYGIVKDLVGHGVGKEIHESPNIPNNRFNPMKKIKVQKGMVIAIEPMLTMGTDQIKLSDDRWTYETADGSLSAQFENTVAVNYDGTVEIMTPTEWKLT